MTDRETIQSVLIMPHDRNMLAADDFDHRPPRAWADMSKLREDRIWTAGRATQFFHVSALVLAWRGRIVRPGLEHLARSWRVVLPHAGSPGQLAILLQRSDVPGTVVVLDETNQEVSP